MRCVDVNVLVYAHRPESPGHGEMRTWLDDARRAATPLGVAEIVASGFLRIVTHPKIFKEPTPLAVALDFVAAVLDAPAVKVVTPGPRQWAIFEDLCRRTTATGNTIPDAYLAAMAIELGATWVTADRAFARFPGLRWEHPLDPG